MGTGAELIYVDELKGEDEITTINFKAGLNIIEKRFMTPIEGWFATSLEIKCKDMYSSYVTVYINNQRTLTKTWKKDYIDEFYEKVLDDKVKGIIVENNEIEQIKAMLKF